MKELFLFRKEHFPVLRQAIKLCKSFGLRTARFSLDKKEMVTMSLCIEMGFELFSYEEVKDSGYINIETKDIKFFEEYFIKWLLPNCLAYSVGESEKKFLIEYLTEQGYKFVPYKNDGDSIMVLGYQRTFFIYNKNPLTKTRAFVTIFPNFPEEIRQKLYSKLQQ